MNPKKFGTIRRNIRNGKILTPIQKKLILTAILFNSGLALSSMFDNIFLFSKGSGLSIILIFNLALYLGSIVFSSIISYSKKKISIRTNVYIGIISFIVFYGIMLNLKSSTLQTVIILGVCKAIGTAFYYAAFNVYIVTNTHDRGRDYFLSVQSLIQGVASIIVPFISSYTLKYLGDAIGYNTIFSITILTMVATVILLYKIPVIESRTEVNVMKFLKLCISNKALRYNMLSEMARGAREGVMAFLTGVLIYEAFRDPVIFGWFNILCTGIGFVSVFLMTRLLKPKNRIRTILIGAIGYAISGIILLINPGATTIFIYGVVATFFSSFISVPTVSITMLVLQTVDVKREMLFESMNIREVLLNVTRSLGLLLFIIMPKDIKTMCYIMAFYSLFYLLLWYFSKKSYIEIQKQIAEQKITG